MITKGVSRRNGLPKRPSPCKQAGVAMKRGLMEAMILKGVSRRNKLPKRPSLCKQAGVGNEKEPDGSHDY
eukprot:5161239-Karenia_brevis.AAC.1